MPAWLIIVNLYGGVATLPMANLEVCARDANVLIEDARHKTYEK